MMDGFEPSPYIQRQSRELIRKTAAVAIVREV